MVLCMACDELENLFNVLNSMEFKKFVIEMIVVGDRIFIAHCCAARYNGLVQQMPCATNLNFLSNQFNMCLCEFLK